MLACGCLYASLWRPGVRAGQLFRYLGVSGCEQQGYTALQLSIWWDGATCVCLVATSLELSQTLVKVPEAFGELAEPSF